MRQDICKDVWGGVKPDPTRCDGFILCILGQGTFIPCGRNHIFDPSVKNCVPGDKETCEASSIVPTTTISVETTTPTTSFTTTTRDPGNIDEVCKGIDFGL